MTKMGLRTVSRPEIRPSHDFRCRTPCDQNSTSTASAHGGGIVKSMCPPASGRSILRHAAFVEQFQPADEAARNSVCRQTPRHDPLLIILNINQQQTVARGGKPAG